MYVHTCAYIHSNFETYSISYALNISGCIVQLILTFLSIYIDIIFLIVRMKYYVAQYTSKNKVNLLTTYTGEISLS